MSKANDRQVDGEHYINASKIQHWDWAASAELDYFQGAITKYVGRWKLKGNGLIDLEKAAHYLEKYIEEVKAGNYDPGHSKKTVTKGR